MPEARPGEELRSRIGRFVVMAIAAVVAVVMVWALYDGSDRLPNFEAAAASTTAPMSPGPTGLAGPAGLAGAAPLAA